MYSGGIYQETAEWRWGCDAEIQAGANAWRNVQRVMMHRKITRKLKGKVMDSCIVPASTYGLETLALSEPQQHKLQRFENNLVRIIAGVRRVERKTMIDLREEVGTKMYGFFLGVLYSTVSRPLDRSKRFTLFLTWQTCSFRHGLGFSGKHSKACIVGKIVNSWMKWAGDMVRINDERLPKISETKKI